MSRSAERAVTKVNAIIRARTADVQFARTPAMRNHTVYRAAFQLTGSVQPNGSISTRSAFSQPRGIGPCSRDLSRSRQLTMPIGFNSSYTLGMHEMRWVRSRLTASATADFAGREMGCLLILLLTRLLVIAS